jgi:hypothetical protein
MNGIHEWRRFPAEPRRVRREFSGTRFAMHLSAEIWKEVASLHRLRNGKGIPWVRILTNEHVQQSIHRGERTLNSRLPICVQLASDGYAELLHQLAIV